MLTKLRLRCILVLTVFLFAFNSQLLSQVSLFSKKVTVDIKNQPVSFVLKSIGNQVGAKFSYDPLVIDAKRVVTVKEANQPLGEVLVRLFNNPAIAFKQVGNQIVIFSTIEKQVQNNTPDNKNGKPVVTNPIDTIYIYKRDTITYVRTDTVYRYTVEIKTDTVVKHDTILIKQPLPSRKYRIKQKDKFFSIEPYAGYMYCKPVFGKEPNYDELYDLTIKASSPRYSNFTGGLNLGYTYKAFATSTGLSYTRYSDNFNFIKTEYTGGYYDVDTVETYFSVHGTDTSWYFIKDSTYLPVESHETRIRNNNSYSYLEIPLQLSIRLLNTERVSLWTDAAVIGGFLLHNDVYSFDPEETNKTIVLSKSDLNPFVLTWQLGISAKLRMNNYLSAVLSGSYRSQTGTLHNGSGFSKHYNSVVLRYGLEFIF